MRPLRLVLQGIGPFVRKTDIDFERLDKRALFLIHGPTGSGKSFLFDAICYALYAQTPAGREAHLRSDYLADGEIPFIDFEFGIGSRRYRVHRELSFQRPKKRGGGVTIDPENQELIFYSDNGPESLGTKKTEVDGKLRNLLGLSLGQFRQVVMIPQGEFRELLLSGSDEREKLLERLFDTEFYKSLQDEFQKREEEGRENLQRNRTRCKDLANEASALLSELEESFGIEPVENEEFRDQLEGRRRALEPNLDALRTTWEESAQYSRESAQKLEQARLLQDDYRNLGVLGERIAEHQSRLDEINRDRELLVLADSAAEIEHVFQETERALSALNESRRALKESEERVEQALGLVESLKSEIEKRSDFEARLDDLERWVSVFGSWRNEAREQLALREKLETALNSRTQAEKVLKTVTDQQAETKQRIDKLDEEIRKLSDTGGATDQRFRRLADLERLLELTDEYESLCQREKAASEKLGEAEAWEREISLHLEKLRKQREENIAGELAAGLLPDSPCPVCGSESHPSPARIHQGYSAEELRKTEEDFRKASLAAAELRERQRGLKADCNNQKRLIGELADSLSLGDTAPSIDVIQGLLTALKGLSAREEELRIERDTLRNETLENINGQIHELSSLVSSATLDAERLDASLAERHERWTNLIESHFKNHPEQIPQPENLPSCLDSWDCEKQELRSRLESLEQRNRRALEDFNAQRASLENNQQNLGRAEQLWRQRSEDFDSALAKYGFANEDAFRAAHKDEGLRESERTRIAEFDRNLAESRLRYEDLEKRIGGRPLPNIAEFNDIAQKADEKTQHLSRELALATTRLERFDVVIQKLEAEEAQSGVREAEHALLQKLSRQLRGVDAPRISLNRFFLARRLEEVLIQATRRLALLSDDRFTLKRREGGRHAGSQAGLDLMISDSWTGTTRPVNSLSGGQLFMAALSLALGLADVVQARSGGIKIEALFIDEGFGTLDEESLQGVLGVLNDLRSDRMVGVISHVGELKRQIGSRIEVSSAKQGSTAELIPG